MSTPRARRQAPAPTDAQIRMAWPHFRGRGQCPATLDEALAHPVWGPCIRRCAQAMGRAFATGHLGAAAAAASRLGRGTYVPPTPSAPPAPPARDHSALARWPKHQPVRTGRWGDRLGAHDAKRAAANDQDDKDFAA